MNKMNPRILVVEDEFIVGIDIKQTLKKSNYFVTSIVNNGVSAVQKAEADKPDLILMDITLKGDMDGIETAAIISSKFGIPIVYLTAFSNPDIKERALSTNPAGYLSKPFNNSELCNTIKQILMQKSGQNKFA